MNDYRRPTHELTADECQRRQDQLDSAERARELAHADANDHAQKPAPVKPARGRKPLTRMSLAELSDRFGQLCQEQYAIKAELDRRRNQRGAH